MTTPYADDTWQYHPLPEDGWRFFTDGVMGGLSKGGMRLTRRDGQDCIELRGQVRTENNGGFIQMAMDLHSSGSVAADFDGVALMVHGNDETYGLHLRTSDLTLPWQSYRASFPATSRWQRVLLPFSSFEPHRTETAMDLGRLRRMGIVAIGGAFQAELCVRGIAFYRESGE